MGRVQYRAKQDIPLKSASYRDTSRSGEICGPARARQRQRGGSLAELLVSLAVSSILLLGVFGSAQQMRLSSLAADSVHSLEERARFVLDLLRADIRAAGFWGLHSDPEQLRLAAGVKVRCGGKDARNWAFRFDAYAAAANDAWPLPCSPFRNRRQPGADMLEIRRAARITSGVDARSVQVLSSRRAAIVFSASTPPSLAGDTELRDLIVHAWYVSARSSRASDVPSLRRKTLARGRTLRDEEVLAGVEDLQIRLGLDENGDGTADRVVDPSATPPPGTRVVAVRYWLLLRHEIPEAGYVDSRTYVYANREPQTFDDARRRLLVAGSERIANAL